ncbi:transporter substrate-binding domain-containing protein [Temperatibacter marinus]|uniref:Transporter substrate-binding domain-containing protein n=1 Tax=Temperatibacter marinus TaxID=1456591 RepID=A0AA52EDT3_9PROT|nr:transporter substrate-binding domain-containing protein [Temperatibacter marinus]WND03632.1 transporter substrate-binding domain-containing protein [Temperatibacter marinus]
MKFLMAFLILVTFVDLSAWAQQTKDKVITIHSFLQPERMDTQLNGDYGKIVRYVRDHVDSPVIVRPTFLARALKNFERGQGNICFFPMANTGLDVFFPGQFSQSNSLISVPVDVVTGRVISRKGMPLVSSLKDMKGKTFSVIRKVLVKRYFPNIKQNQLVKAPSDSNNIRMLVNGRVNYMITFMPDIALSMRAINFKEYTFDPDFLFFESTTAIICKRTEKTEHFMNQANKLIIDLQQSGKMKALMSEFSQPAVAGSEHYSRLPHFRNSSDDERR